MKISPELAWAYGFWSSDNSSNKLGIINTNIRLVREFKEVVSKLFPNSNFKVWIYLQKRISKRKETEEIKNIGKELQISEDNIKIYINPNQYGQKIYQLITNEKTAINNFYSFKLMKLIGSELKIAYMAGKLDGDGGVNLARGTIEWYYDSEKSFSQMKKEAKILKNLQLNPKIRKHGDGRILQLGSKKEDFRFVVLFAKKAIRYVESENKKKALYSLMKGEKIREKDLIILSLVKEGLTTSKKLRNKLGYTERTMRQILQNVTEVGYLRRNRNTQYEYYNYFLTKKGLSYFNGTKPEG